MIRRTAASLGLLGFAIAVCGGLVIGNSFEGIIVRALQIMLILAAVGLVVGWSAQRVVREYRSQQYLEVFGQPESSENTTTVSSENNSTPAPS